MELPQLEKSGSADGATGVAVFTAGAAALAVPVGPSTVVVCSTPHAAVTTRTDSRQLDRTRDLVMALRLVSDDHSAADTGRRALASRETGHQKDDLDRRPGRATRPVMRILD
jgi:hypothetical protein